MRHCFPFELLVGLRYTRAGKRARNNSFISFISATSMLGIMLGVAALIIVLSVMNGFQKEVRDRMLSVLAHVEISGANGALSDWKKTAQIAGQHPEVKASAPYVVAQAMLIRDGSVRGVVLRGIVPDLEKNVSQIAQQIKSGAWDSLQPSAFNILLGGELARALRVKVGDKVMMISPQGQITPAGVIPRLKQFTVSGIFEAGHYEYDAAFAFIHLDDATRMFQLDAPSGLRLRIADMERAPLVSNDIARMLTLAEQPDVFVSDWSQQNRTWFAAVKTEKRMMFLILALIIAVAAFNLVSTLVMTVTDKQADIAILRTLGASPGSIMKIFIIQGALVGLVGVLSGVGLGVLVALNIDVIVPFIEHLMGVQFLPKEIYFISQMPSELRWHDVSSIAIFSIILALLATLYPSWRAAQVKPVEALRYE